MDLENSDDERVARASHIERRRVRAAMHERLFGAAAEPVCVGRFELRRKLGEGASSVVYAAFDPQLQREVAIKLVLVDPASDADALSEARALAQLRHPNLLPAFEIGAHEGLPFVVTELVDGTDLRAWLAEQRSPTDSVAVIVGLGRGLAEVHRAGFVHRDVKPENVFVERLRPRLGDFGVAREFGDGDGSRAVLPGTPAYMAPEHRRGVRADPRSDQFAFALVAFEIAFGFHPLVQAGRVDPSHPLAHLEAILRRGFDESASARFGSVEELLAALEARAAARPKRHTGLAWGAFAAVVLTLFALGAWRFSERPISAPLESPSQRAARVFQEVMPMMAAQRFAECAAYLESRADTTPLVLEWIACADRVDDPALLDRACAAWPANETSELPGECDPVRRAGRRDQLAGRFRACFDRLIAAPPTPTRLIILSRCHAELPRNDETSRHMCMYGLRLNGNPHPELGCGNVVNVDRDPPDAGKP